MGRPKRWITSRVNNGFYEVRLSSWKYFSNYINDIYLDYNHYIWRGQKREDWKLEPSLDRIFKNKDKKKTAAGITREHHLSNFQYATRGRRGFNPPELSENEWWALGQHQGLQTPFLDWTSSPYVAAYFAFAEDGKDITPRRAIWAMFRPSIDAKNIILKKNHHGSDRPPIIEIVSPLSGDNSRLVNQAGLFTRAPDNVDIETWFIDNFKEDKPNVLRLVKITVPDHDRDIALRSLNRMNINHLTLFPDLYGASKYCNLSLVTKSY